MSRLARSSTTPTTHQFTELTAQTVLLGALPAQVCNGGDRQHVQFPYCSDACWREHAKDGRVHGPAGTKAWADDTTNAIWRRGRLKEVNANPRSVGALQVDIKIGDPLSSTFYQQQREQEEPEYFVLFGQGESWCTQSIGLFSLSL
jgi:hypothetical protein